MDFDLLVDTVQVLLIHFANFDDFTSIYLLGWVYGRSHSLTPSALDICQQIFCELSFAHFSVLAFAKYIVNKDDKAVYFSNLGLSTMSCFTLAGGGQRPVLVRAPSTLALRILLYFNHSLTTCSLMFRFTFLRSMTPFLQISSIVYVCCGLVFKPNEKIFDFSCCSLYVKKFFLFAVKLQLNRYQFSLTSKFYSLKCFYNYLQGIQQLKSNWNRINF